MPAEPDVPPRHARLFELIRQSNLADRQARRHAVQAPGAVEAQLLVKRAARSLDA